MWRTRCRWTGTSFTRAADTLLLGRDTFVDFRDHFVAVPDDPATDAPNRLVVRLFANIDKMVVSDTLPERIEGPWANTTVVRRADANNHIAALRQGEGRDILIIASHTLWNDLLADGVVDELHLTVAPDLFGEGVSLFTGAARAQLRLLDVTPYPGSDSVRLRYGAHPSGE